jgi:hypothetical protein
MIEQRGHIRGAEMSCGDRLGRPLDYANHFSPDGEVVELSSGRGAIFA